MSCDMHSKHVSNYQKSPQKYVKYYSSHTEVAGQCACGDEDSAAGFCVQNRTQWVNCSFCGMEDTLQEFSWWVDFGREGKVRLPVSVRREQCHLGHHREHCCPVSWGSDFGMWQKPPASALGHLENSVFSEDSPFLVCMVYMAPFTAIKPYLCSAELEAEMANRTLSQELGLHPHTSLKEGSQHSSCIPSLKFAAFLYRFLKFKTSDKKAFLQYFSFSLLIYCI